MDTLRSALLYFAAVFGAGFVLGPIRMLWAVPRFGQRWAELMEMPIMLWVVVLAARWTVRRLAVPPAPARRLRIGVVALAVLLAAELALTRWSRGLSIREYIASLDPVSGTVYGLMLGVFALMPLLVRAGGGRAERP